MNLFIGYAFTDDVIENLQNSGFEFFMRELTEVHGYKSYLLALEDSSPALVAIEIREILEEQKYLTHHKVKKFEPCQVEGQQIPESQHLLEHLERKAQPNTVHRIREIISAASEFSDQDLQTYFKLRKKSALWAIVLECDNFSKFKTLASPDKIINWKGKEAALLHLGPNCFDLLVVC